MKAIRFALINLPARVLERSRYLLVRPDVISFEDKT
jgi:hypothetical protein